MGETAKGRTVVPVGTTVAVTRKTERKLKFADGREVYGIQRKISMRISGPSAEVISGAASVN